MPARSPPALPGASRPMFRYSSSGRSLDARAARSQGLLPAPLSMRLLPRTTPGRLWSATQAGCMSRTRCVDRDLVWLGAGPAQPARPTAVDRDYLAERLKTVDGAR